jgi:SPX domain protein involved in polyphosphate accumulation
MASRYELKYLIPHRIAIQVREFVQQHFDLDEFGNGRPNWAYPVHSLYLDSDNWEIFWRTVNGDKNRFKLRIRYYNDAAETPVFWEIKRRMKDVILKERCAIRRAYAAYVMNGQLPAPHEMFSPHSTSEQKAIQDFLRLQFDIGAVPKMHVVYDREAYVHGKLNDFRITFDRHVRVATRFDGSLTTRMEDPFVCTGPCDDPEDVVILELKFTDRFPNWYRDLICRFDLMQTGAAKFCEGTFMYAGRDLPARDVVRNMVF